MALNIPYTFKQDNYRKLALTHRSFGKPNNERLEFLGDSLVNMLVAQLLFDAHPHASEGELSRLRSQLVNGDALAEVARTIRLGDDLRLGQGELKSGGFRRDSILADAFEALLAAVYLDGGFVACQQLVTSLFADKVAHIQHSSKDAKTRLQEYLQARHLSLPTYTLIDARGDDHAKTFVVSCTLEQPQPLAVTGQGGGRRRAEQKTAALMLEKLKGLLEHD